MRISSLAYRISMLLPLGLVAATLTLALPKLAATWEVNEWSLAIGKRILVGPLGLQDLMPVPRNHVRAQSWLALDAVRRGDASQALAVLGFGPKQEGPIRVRARIEALHANGDVEAAIRLASESGDLIGLLQMGNSSESNGEFEPALSAYCAAYRLNKQEAVLPLANLLIGSLEDPLEAELVLRGAIDETTQRQSRYPSLLGRRLADLLRMQGKYSEAEQAYLSVLANSPEDFNAMIGLGRLYHEQDDFRGARELFGRAIIVNSESAQGYYWMGQVAAQQQDYASADLWFQDAIRRAPGNRRWHVERGNTAREAGDLARAVEVFQGAISQFPDFTRAYFELAKTYELTGESGQALEAYRAVLDIDPKHKGAIRAAERLEGSP